MNRRAVEINMKNLFKNFRERLYLRFVHKFYARDLLLDLRLQAKRETLEYINRNMRHCVICQNQKELFEYALTKTGPGGLNAEFGVSRGRSIKLLGKLIDGTVYGFDSFSGLPEDWSGTTEKQGGFVGRPGKLPENIKLYEGLFMETLPKFIEEHDLPMRFIHVDCDLYSSARTIFTSLKQRIEPGTVIVFDEYFNYPNWQEHEYKAFQEFIREESRGYRYLAFTARGGSVAVKITA